MRAAHSTLLALLALASCSSDATSAAAPALCADAVAHPSIALTVKSNGRACDLTITITDVADGSNALAGDGFTQGRPLSAGPDECELDGPYERTGTFAISVSAPGAQTIDTTAIVDADESGCLVTQHVSLTLSP